MAHRQAEAGIFFKQSQKAVDSTTRKKGNRNMLQADQADCLVPARGQQEPGPVFHL